MLPARIMGNTSKDTGMGVLIQYEKKGTRVRVPQETLFKFDKRFQYLHIDCVDGEFQIVTSNCTIPAKQAQVVEL